MKVLNKWKGFTLMEVMIVVAIIGILAAIGIPSYRKYVIKSHRKEAIAQMLDIVGLLERNYANNGQYMDNYVNDPTGLNNDPNINRTPAGSVGTQIRYNITINLNAGANPGSQTYTITATPNAANDQSLDNRVCGTMSIDQAGVRLSMVQVPPGQVIPNCF